MLPAHTGRKGYTMKNVKVASYSEFNPRRYSNPWIAICDEKCKPDFSQKIGEYTGAYGKGEAGELIVYEPVDGAVYMFGQKDCRKTQNSEREFAIFHHARFWPHSKMECLNWLSDEAYRISIAEANLGRCKDE